MLRRRKSLVGEDSDFAESDSPDQSPAPSARRPSLQVVTNLQDYKYPPRSEGSPARRASNASSPSNGSPLRRVSNASSPSGKSPIPTLSELRRNSELSSPVRGGASAKTKISTLVTDLPRSTASSPTAKSPMQRSPLRRESSTTLSRRNSSASPLREGSFRGSFRKDSLQVAGHSRVRASPLTPQKEEVFGDETGDTDSGSEGSTPDVLSPEGRGSFRRFSSSLSRRESVIERKAEAEEERQRQVDELHARAEEKRAQAAEEKWARPKRELGMQRCCLWLQVLCAAAPTYTLKHMAAAQHSVSILRRIFLPVLWRWKFARNCRRKLQERDELTRAMLATDEIKQPTVEDLKKVEFFKGWGEYSLTSIVRSMTPVFYKAGEFIVMEGDWGNVMFLVERGTVEVTVRDPKAPNAKSHRQSGRLRLAEITPDDPRPFFGEFAILCNEPRSASVTALTDCNLWSISKAIVDDVMTTLQPSIRRRLRELADSRRTQILARIYPLTADMLRHGHPIFRCWSTSALTAIAEKFEARVLQADYRIIKEGDAGDYLFFIASGQVSVRKKEKDDPPAPPDPEDEDPVVKTNKWKPVRRMSLKGSDPLAMSGSSSPSNSSPTRRLPSLDLDETVTSSPTRRERRGSVVELDETVSSTTLPPARRERRGSVVRTSPPKAEVINEVTVATLKAGDIFGEIAVLFLEPRTASVVAETPVDLWQLPRQHLLDTLIANPDWYMTAKQLSNARRARWLQPCPSSLWVKHPILTQHLPTKLLKDLTQRLEPRVIEKTNTLVLAGEACDGILCLTSGQAKRHNEIIEAGSLVGVPEVLTFQPNWTGSVFAVTKCEAWFLPIKTLWHTLKKSHKEAMKKLTSEKTQDELTKTHLLPRRALPSELEDTPKRPKLERRRSMQSLVVRSCVGDDAPPGSPRFTRVGSTVGKLRQGKS